MKYDLEERTAKFGEDIIDFAQNLNRGVINLPLISQIVRSATSKKDALKKLWGEAHELTMIFSKIVSSAK